jgi:hypothetical protein
LEEVWDANARLKKSRDLPIPILLVLIRPATEEKYSITVRSFCELHHRFNVFIRLDV